MSVRLRLVTTFRCTKTWKLSDRRIHLVCTALEVGVYRKPAPRLGRQDLGCGAPGGAAVRGGWHQRSRGVAEGFREVCLVAS